MVQQLRSWKRQLNRCFAFVMVLGAVFAAVYTLNPFGAPRVAVDSGIRYTPSTNPLKPVHRASKAALPASGLQTGQQIAANFQRWQAMRSSHSPVDAQISALSATQRNAIDRLISILGTSAELRMDDESGTLRYLEGDLIRVADSSSEYRQAHDHSDFGAMAIALAQELAPVLNLRDPARELVVERIQQDEQGMTHVRLNQVYRDIPIWGAQIGVHFNAAQEPSMLSGVYSPTPDMPETIERISPDNALLLARAAIQAQTPVNSDLVPPTVRRTIYWDLNRQPVDCWNVELAPDFNQAWEIFIATADGSVVHRYDKITTEGVTGQAADLKGEMRSMPCWNEQGTYYAINTGGIIIKSVRSIGVLLFCSLVKGD